MGACALMAVRDVMYEVCSRTLEDRLIRRDTTVWKKEGNLWGNNSVQSNLYANCFKWFQSEGGLTVHRFLKF